MNNPRINLRLLRQALAAQFAVITYQNGERDDFRRPFQELTNSQKHSLIALGNDLAKMELTVRLDNRQNSHQSIIEFPKFCALRPDLITSSEFIEECSECDNKCTHVFVDYIMGDTTTGERPITFQWQVFCSDHLPTPE